MRARGASAKTDDDPNADGHVLDAGHDTAKMSRTAGRHAHVTRKNVAIVAATPTCVVLLVVGGLGPAAETQGNACY